jgi:hypothetical protein
MVRLYLLFAILIIGCQPYDEQMKDMIALKNGQLITCDVYLSFFGYKEAVLYDGSIIIVQPDEILGEHREKFPVYLWFGFRNAQVSHTPGFSSSDRRGLMRDVIHLRDESKICGLIKPTKHPESTALHKYDGSVQVIKNRDIKDKWSEYTPYIQKEGYEFLTADDHDQSDFSNTVFCDKIEDSHGNVYQGIVIKKGLKRYQSIMTYGLCMENIPAHKVVKHSKVPAPKYLEKGYQYLQATLGLYDLFSH